MRLELDDCRRLTGKNLLSDYPGSILDAFVDGFDKKQIIAVWRANVEKIHQDLNWPIPETFYRIFEDGVSLAIAAEFDHLYGSCAVNELAWSMTCNQTANIDMEMTYEEGLNNVHTELEPELNPGLVKLIHQAEQRNACYLTDDDEFSLGYGPTCEVWPVSGLPQATAVQWQKYNPVPVAYITGTNGKSTTVRMASSIMKQSGKVCGVTSTDFIKVGDHIIDEGDYSGPGGARMLLRHPQTEVALLEVARGGLLRRGLPVPKVDAALITNIASDHLGQYGINTLEALTQAKGIVAKGLDSGPMILNADDDNLCRFGDGLDKTLLWFSLSKNNTRIVQAIAEHQACCYLDDDHIVYFDGEQGQQVVNVKDIPITLGGAAMHNVQNALAATALTSSLGASIIDIQSALSKFGQSNDDNPGRANQYQIKGATVVVDFAHNEHSMDAMADTMRNVEANKRYLMLSAAGDRSDEETSAMTRSALSMQPDVIVFAEVERYLRGREPGELGKLMTQVSLEQGFKPSQIVCSSDPSSGTKHILEQLSSGDLALLMVLTDREAVEACLATYS